MSSSPWIVQFESGTYRFGQVRVDECLTEAPSTEPGDLEPLVLAMRDAGYSGQPVLLAIPSDWCLCAAVTLTSRRLMRNRQALAYALEEQLPLAAEDMVCDFIIEDTAALGVAVDPARLAPIVQSLEESGVAVTAVTPSALLLLDQLQRQNNLSGEGLVLLIHQEYCDYFVTAANTPRQWRYLPADPTSLRREVAVHLMSVESSSESPLPVTILAADQDVPETLTQLEPDIELRRLELAEDPTLLSAVSDVLVKAKRPLIDLRRDQIGTYDPYSLVRGSLRFLAATFLLALLTLTTATWIQTGRYHALVQEFDARKAAVFQQLFPEMRVPVGIRSRLESERQKLIGLMGDHLEAPEVESATPMLLKTLDALPADLRLRLLEMQFENATGYLEGEVRRHGDADVIAASLREQGLTVEPPRTEHLETDGVAFSLAVARTAPDASQE